jgi:hypothetical protein
VPSLIARRHLSGFASSWGGLQPLKIGNVVEIHYVPGRSPELHKFREAPPTEGIVPLPQ